VEPSTGLVKPHIVIHDIPKHRCPLCQHICHTTKSRARQRAEKEGKGTLPRPTGRPPTTRKIIVEILRQEASYDRPMTAKELQDRLEVGFLGLSQIIYRARNIDNAPIKFKGSRTNGEGYYLDERE
jgi:hypothetical protein